MKTLFVIALAAGTLGFVACESTTTEETTTVVDTPLTPLNPEPITTTTTTTTTRTPTEGDVTWESGRVRVYRGTTWVDADNDVKLDNDIVIYRDGHARKAGTDVEWEDGYVVDRSGNVWDRTGNAIEGAWDATKHGYKKARNAVGNAAEKVGDKAKDAVD